MNFCQRCNKKKSPSEGGKVKNLINGKEVGVDVTFEGVENYTNSLSGTRMFVYNYLLTLKAQGQIRETTM